MSAPAVKLAPASPVREAGFGLYVHWPFCRAKCPYCDFNSHVRTGIDEARWRAALLTELEHAAAQAPGRTLTSIFFGGGTPSLMDAETVAQIIDRASQRWAFARDIEITLEANPNSAEAARFRDYRRAGVNRLSIGVQALDDAALAFLGRLHGRDEAIRAIECAAKIFPRYSFDLIYARPGQTSQSWMRELREALLLAGTHLSLYQLTLEQGTAFHAKAARGEFTIPDADAAAELFEITQDEMDRAGLPAYEISNHAPPGDESRHNLVYWRYGEYAGVGPGAHGRLALWHESGARAKTALRQIREPEAWLAAVERDGHGTAETQALSDEERGAEMLMMGLRLREGVAADAFERETGVRLAEYLDARALGDLTAGGFLEWDGDGLRASAAGRLCLNAVLGRLLAGSG
jgi:oxygen-independent coproporphyrinogen-3 oxidase